MRADRFHTPPLKRSTCTLPGVVPTPSCTARQERCSLLFCKYAKLGTRAESCDRVRGIAALAPPVSSLLVMTEMSALYQEDSHVACPAHSQAPPPTHTHTHTVIINMDTFQISHKQGGFVLGSQPRAGLATTCRRPGQTHFFMRLFPSSFVGQSLCSGFYHLQSWRSPVTELWLFLWLCSLLLNINSDSLLLAFRLFWLFKRLTQPFVLVSEKPIDLILAFRVIFCSCCRLEETPSFHSGGNMAEVDVCCVCDLSFHRLFKYRN